MRTRTTACLIAPKDVLAPHMPTELSHESWQIVVEIYTIFSRSCLVAAFAETYFVWRWRCGTV